MSQKTPSHPRHGDSSSSMASLMISTIDKVYAGDYSHFHQSIEEVDLLFRDRAQ